MADELKITLQVQLTNGELKDTINPGQKKFDQTTARAGGPGVVNIGTSEENISFGDITPGYVYLQNLDATNYVEFGMDDSSTIKKLGKLQPGGVALFELAASQTLRMIANTAACDVLIKGFNT